MLEQLGESGAQCRASLDTVAAAGLGRWMEADQSGGLAVGAVPASQGGQVGEEAAVAFVEQVDEGLSGHGDVGTSLGAGRGADRARRGGTCR